MTDGDLPYIREQFGALRDDIREVREDIKDLRDEMQTTFMRHDESDNRRFAELFERLRPLEITHALFHRGEEQETEAEHKKHGYAVARIGAIAAVLGGGGAEIMHWVFAFFTQRGN